MDRQKIKRGAPAFVGRFASGAVQLLARDSVQFLKTGAMRFALCAILARGSILGGYAPFGLAMAAALMATGARLSVVAGVFCGTMLLGGGMGSMLYAAATVLTLCVITVFGGLACTKKLWFAPVVATLTGMMCTFVLLPIGQALSGTDLLRYFCAAGITLACSYLYAVAFAPPRVQSDWRRPAVLLAIAATILLSLSDIEIITLFAPARVLALLLVLGSAYLGSASIGAAVGVAFGAAMDLASGGGAVFTCSYGLIALVSGMFHEQGRFLFSVCAVAAGACAAMLAIDSILFVPLLIETVLAVILFSVLPPVVWTALQQTLLPEELTSSTASREIKRTAGQCASEAAQAFYELYTSMLTSVQNTRVRGDQNVSVVFDKASDKVCKSCPLCSQCWQRDYVTTLSALNDATEPMLARGKAIMSDFPHHFTSRCVRVPELIRAINSALFALREREAMKRQEEENQTLLAKQYAGITDILRHLSREAAQGCAAQPILERQVRRYTAAFGWVEHVSVFRDASSRLVIELFGEGISDIEKQGGGFSAGLGALLGVKLTEPRIQTEGIGRRLVMRERAPYRVVVGVARQQKQDTSVSGDSGCYFLTDAGVACLVLADGMGTGTAAAQDSRTIITSMERFLRAGVEPHDAVNAISPVFRLRANGTRFVTLDLLTLDLFTGKAQGIKFGSAPSYMKMGETWKRILCKTLPIGIAEDADPTDLFDLSFMNGDMYVMVSDGVSDGTDDEWMQTLLRERQQDSPKELAAKLVTEGFHHNTDDDRTAIVMKIERREE